MSLLTLGSECSRTEWKEGFRLVNQHMNLLLTPESIHFLYKGNTFSLLFYTHIFLSFLIYSYIYDAELWRM